MVHDIGMAMLLTYSFHDDDDDDDDDLTPVQPYLDEAMSWSCLAIGLRFVARLRCTANDQLIIKT